MNAGTDLYARPQVEVPALGAALTAALVDLPEQLRADLIQHRAMILAEPSDLGAKMRFIESTAVDRGLPARCVLELWAWVSYLAIVRGYRSTTTVAGYARNLAVFLAWCAGNQLDFTALQMQDFDSWQKWLYLKHKHSPRWRSRQAASVRSFYDWRKTRGLGENCATNLRSPRIPSSMARKYTMPQLQRMLAATASRRDEALRQRDKTVLLVLLSTGMRREEIHRLNLDDLELGKTVGVVRINGKGAKQREVSFEGPVVDALRDWLLQRDQLPMTVEPRAVFISTSPNSAGHRLAVNSFERIVGRCAKEAKLHDWGVHRFRVTFATALYDAGHEIEEIRILMGHENIETTRRYLAVSERARRTRLSAQVQHQALGSRRMGKPRWVTAALGGATND